MMGSTAKSFYQRYFSATQEASWLARLMAGRQRCEILGELMQWGVTSTTSDQ
ncbi:glucose uptake inhibitor SgrT [Klebsiella pneumoniae]|nr:glucose uptake inhibitor SgrT [Klebsiella pneumoniae]